MEAPLDPAIAMVAESPEFFWRERSERQKTRTCSGRSDPARLPERGEGIAQKKTSENSGGLYDQWL